MFTQKTTNLLSPSISIFQHPPYFFLYSLPSSLFLPSMLSPGSSREKKTSYIFDPRHRYNVKLFNLPGLTGISVSRREDQNSLIYRPVPPRSSFSPFLCPSFSSLTIFLSSARGGRLLVLERNNELVNLTVNSLRLSDPKETFLRNYVGHCAPHRITYFSWQKDVFVPLSIYPCNRAFRGG